MKKLLLASLVALLTFGLAIAAKPKGTTQTLRVDNINREMIVYVPADLPDNAPLVITFHGFNQSAGYQQDNTNWNETADTAKFVVVYPQYDGGWWDTSGQKDINFAKAIIKKMNEDYGIDKNRVYISGFSLGSMMTYHCIEHMADQVAAFAPVSGVRFDNRAPITNRPGRKVPIIHTHGTADDVFKWEGDLNHGAGGYPYIPDYVMKWVKYEGLNTTPEVIDPYKNGYKTIYRDDNGICEIELLAITGCGHWHSEGADWGGISTCQEIWNFCKRYYLGQPDPVPAQVVKVEPEDCSFDLVDQQEFSVTFDKPIDFTRISAKIGDVDLVNTMTENSATATFALPAGAQLNGDCKFYINNVADPTGGKVKAYAFDYTFGITEVGEQANVVTYLSSDEWDDMQAEVGEGIPFGWQRINTKADGSTEKTVGGAANCGGARLKYFQKGGAFNTGFYFSARDNSKIEFSYGKVSKKALGLEPGLYDLTFKSTLWNSASVGATYSVGLNNNTGKIKVLNIGGLTSAGNLNENTDQKVVVAKEYKYTVEVPEKNKYVLSFDMEQGWSAVVLGGIKLTSHESNAERYKGTFYRLYKQAEALYADPDYAALTAELTALKAALDKYAGFASTAPSAYQAAIAELQAAVDALKVAAGVTDAAVEADIVATEYYTIDGRRAAPDYKGIAIRRDTLANGTVTVSKVSLR